jgi:oligopeptide/dipeptide ABC transporter ATP-binding protein
MMETENPLLEIKNLHTWFPIQRGIMSRTVGHVKAVDGVSLKVFHGETLGLVGESGCGKTTLGRTIVGLEKATRGSVTFDGHDLLAMSERDFRPFRKKLQMIFQDPFSSLNPRMTVQEIITEGLAQFSMLEGSPAEAAARLLGEVGLDSQYIHRYPHEFSGGQRQRLSVARAISVQPEFIVCDEAVSALDVSVQAQVVNLLMELRDRYELSLLFISHDLSVVRHISDRIAVMYLGRIVEYGHSDTIIEAPHHPYTQALISAVPIPGEPKKQRVVLQGDVPSPSAPPPGCHFHTRCPFAQDKCRDQVPVLSEAPGTSGGHHLVACHFAGNLHKIDATN